MKKPMHINKYCIFVILLLILVYSAFCADKGPVFLCGADYSMTEIFNDNTNLVGFHVSLIFGNFGFGFAGHKSMDNFSPEGYDNGDLIYGGFDLRYMPMRNSIIHIDGRCFIGTGYMDIDFVKNYTMRKESDVKPDDLNGKNFYVIEPGIYASIYLMENFRIGYGFTYRQCLRDGFETLDESSISGISNNLVCEIVF